MMSPRRTHLKTLSLLGVMLVCLSAVVMVTVDSDDSDAATYSDLGGYYSSGVNQSTPTTLYSLILTELVLFFAFSF